MALQWKSLREAETANFAPVVYFGVIFTVRQALERLATLSAREEVPNAGLISPVGETDVVNAKVLVHTVHRVEHRLLSFTLRASIWQHFRVF